VRAVSAVRAETYAGTPSFLCSFVWKGSLVDSVKGSTIPSLDNWGTMSSGNSEECMYPEI